MGDCTICGKPGGFLRSKHADCEAGLTETHESSDAPLGFESSVFGAVSAKMGRPYELEASRITAVVENVQALKREGNLEEAIQVLLPQLDLWEKDAQAGLGGVAPWYYEQAAIIYRKLKRFDDEIAVLERFASQPHAPGASPPELLQRLEKAKWKAGRRDGIDAPKPVFEKKVPVGASPASSPKSPPTRLAANQKPIRDFIALDVETANADLASICSIGLAHFRAGELFKTLTILVDPEDHFDPTNISIHGIAPEDVAGRPNMARVFPVIASSLSDVLVVHHSHFDKTALARAALKYGTGPLPCMWLDTLRVARRAWPDLSLDGGGYGLARLANEFAIDFEHHDAAEDAKAAGYLMLRAMQDTGLDLVQWIDRVERPIQEDQGRVARGGAASGPLVGEVIAFTGKLDIRREEAARLASEAGCEVSDTVNHRLTILVVGDQDLRLTKGQERSAKHRKAEGLIAKGATLRIVGEADFMQLVGNTRF
ncbi:exonuclease domain-containing protein [Bradyrhizobium sp. DASA03007]|uniref:exonuclease domain-containing protein n=1 Tax=unclassified Bradyrhizobium TaxID=2631580 RepID=UPI003F725413